MRSVKLAALGLMSAALYAQAGAVAETPLKLVDIEVSAQLSDMNILVKLNGQPKAAQVRSNRNGLVLSLDGLDLEPFEIQRPDAPYIKHARARQTQHGASIVLEGQKITHAETVLYKNAVLIRTKLATPLPPKPSYIGPVPLPQEKSSTPVKPLTISDVAGLSNDTCMAAEKAVADNPWELDKLGDHILCLLDANKVEAAKPQLEQLSAFAPDDWRVSFANAELLRLENKDSDAQIAYSNALNLTENATIRTRLNVRLTAYQASLTMQ